MKMFSVKKHIFFILAMILVLGLFAACTASVPGQSASGEPSAQKETAAPEVKVTPVPETDAPIAETEEPTEEPAKEEPTEEPEPTPYEILSYRDMAEYSHEEYMAIFNEIVAWVETNISAEADETSKIDVPVYYERDLIYKTDPYPPFNYGFDAASCGDSEPSSADFRQFLKAYPSNAFRKCSDGHGYLMYDTDSSYRMYLFTDNFCYRCGIPLIMSKDSDELLKMKDFSGLKVNDPIEKVIEVDPIAEFYKSYEEFREYKGGLNISFDWGLPYSSLHYLSDGIIRISYRVNESNDLYIAKIERASDYMLPSPYNWWDENLYYVDHNYHILDIDLP